MIRTAALLALTLLASCAGLTDRTVGVAQELRLATWNLEHLAAQNGTGCRPRTDNDYAELRSHAERLQADVIALQEVENEAAAARVFTPDRWTVVVSDRRTRCGRASAGARRDRRS